MNLLKLEPARLFAIISALIVVAAAFGLPLSGSQTTALLAFAVAILGGGEAVRSQVTPLADPKL